MTDIPDKTLLLTGFEPFGDFKVNPSELIVKALDGQIINGLKITGLVLPVTFDQASELLVDAVERTRPCAVISLGLAAERREISIERLAVNLIDARIPDNAGNQPVDQYIFLDGAPAYWSTLPVKAMVASLHQKGIPASVSMSAGTFVCNHVFYHLMRTLAAYPGVCAGFIHLPSLATEQDPVSDYSATNLDTLVTGIKNVIGTLVSHRNTQALT